MQLPLGFKGLIEHTVIDSQPIFVFRARKDTLLCSPKFLFRILSLF